MKNTIKLKTNCMMDIKNIKLNFLLAPAKDTHFLCQYRILMMIVQDITLQKNI